MLNSPFPNPTHHPTFGWLSHFSPLPACWHMMAVGPGEPFRSFAGQLQPSLQHAHFQEPSCLPKGFLQHSDQGPRATCQCCCETVWNLTLRVYMQMYWLFPKCAFTLCLLLSTIYMHDFISSSQHCSEVGSSSIPILQITDVPYPRSYL